MQYPVRTPVKCAGRCRCLGCREDFCVANNGFNQTLHDVDSVYLHGGMDRVVREPIQRNQLHDVSSGDVRSRVRGAYPDCRRDCASPNRRRSRGIKSDARDFLKL